MGTNKQKTIPPELFRDEDLMSLDDAVIRTAFGLYFDADDSGRESTTEWRLKAALWPHRPEVTEETIVDHLLILAEVGYLGIYTAQDRTYYQIRKWASQSHPDPSKHPAPPPELFRNLSGTNPENFSAGEREGAGGGSSTGEWVERPPGMPPSPFCPIHQPNGTRANCRHCGTARLAHEQYFEQLGIAPNS